MATAKNLICNLCIWCYIANDDLFTLNNHNAANSSGVMCCSSAAPAQCFNLQGVYTVGKFN